MPAIVRHFISQDADSVQRLVLGIQREEFGVAVTLEEQPDLRDIPTYYQKDHGAFWVAVDGPELVGTIGLLDIGHGQGALRKMFVAPSHRGAAVGLAPPSSGLASIGRPPGEWKMCYLARPSSSGRPLPSRPVATSPATAADKRGLAKALREPRPH
jgi:acetyltransferase (GNAT) family protein